MKYLKTAVGFLLLACLLAACGEKPQTQAPTAPTYKDITKLVLADDGITENGAPVSTDSATAVYTARDIVYYEAGKDFTYGEGSEKDAHTPEEAAAHTVVHITQPGTYRLSGKLSLGQIAVDLGEDAEEDPSAVVTLILNGVDITYQVAPAVIFYRVYECGDKDTEKASKNVDTTAAQVLLYIFSERVTYVTYKVFVRCRCNINITAVFICCS